MVHLFYSYVGRLEWRIDKYFEGRQAMGNAAILAVAEHEERLRAQAAEVIEESILFGCEDDERSRSDSLRLVCEVAERMWREESTACYAPESRIDFHLRTTRESLQLAGETLESLRVEVQEFKRALARREVKA